MYCTIFRFNAEVFSAIKKFDFLEENKMNQFNMEDLQKNLGNGNFQEEFDLSGAKLDLQTTVERLVIEDIIVINAGRKNKITVPDGYEKIDGDLNEGAGGDYIYFAVKRGTDASKAINGLAVVAGKNSRVSAPAGFEKMDMDLNKGAGGRYIYLCKRRGKEGPIHDVRVISAKNANPPAPEGYTMISQDLNEKAGGKYIYLCYC